MKATLHRQTHPIHWHSSMLLAIAAILLTSFKTSGEMLRALQALPIHADVLSSVYQRDAESLHLPVILASGLKHATMSGR